MSATTQPSVGSDTAAPAVGDGKSSRPWFSMGVRTKILASMLGLITLGMVAAGITTFVIENQRLRSQVDAELLQEVREFRALAVLGVDPETGKPFTSVEQLLRTTLQRNVPGTYESLMAMLDGTVTESRHGERAIALDIEPAVRSVIASAPPGSAVKFHTVTGSGTEIRMVHVPVGITGRPAVGSYVIAVNLGGRQSELFDMIKVYSLVALATIAVVGAAGWAIAGRLMRPLDLLRRNASRISTSDFSERIPVRGNDDISELTRSYNQMLDRLETSFAAQREFLDDAGHELRTPLTILSGHLEVMDPTDIVTTAETKDLLIDEVDRMSRLVEDLILLAKSRRPDFVSPDMVDLADITDTALSKASALGDRQWVLDEIADARIPADGQRLTQALLLLAHNAVKFSQPGSTVGFGSRVTPDSVQLWVKDQGIGIEHADQERIFDRFARTETGRGIEGSGLGLAIVEAIAAGHDGRVELSSIPGVGSRFTIVLPYRGAANGESDPTDPPTDQLAVDRHPPTLRDNSIVPGLADPEQKDNTR